MDSARDLLPALPLRGFVVSSPQPAPYVCISPNYQTLHMTLLHLHSTIKTRAYPPCAVFRLVFNLGDDFMPYSKEVTNAVDAYPPQHMMNSSRSGGLAMMTLAPHRVGIAQSQVHGQNAPTAAAVVSALRAHGCAGTLSLLLLVRIGSGTRGGVRCCLCGNLASRWTVQSAEFDI